MKNEFFEHFSLSDNEIKELWKNAVFVLDTSVLLNFYRYSEDSKNKFIEKIQELGPRVWYVHQTIHEYLKNRLSEIQKQKDLYSDALKDIEKLEKLFEHDRQHPFIPKKLLNKMKKLNLEVKEELNKGREFQDSRINNDDIRDRLVEISSGKVGGSYPEKELSKIYEDGKIRYEKNVPPGYTDKAKIAAGDGSAFGDLIVWKQIMDYSKKEKKDIIFVTDDKKEDWWLMSKEKTVGPRPELVREFWTATNQKIQFYQPFQFLKYVGEFLESKVGEEVIKEVKNASPSSSYNRKLGKIDSSGFYYKNYPTRSFANLKTQNIKNLYFNSPKTVALREIRTKLRKYELEKRDLIDIMANSAEDDPEIIKRLGQVKDRILELLTIEAVLQNDSQNDSN